jgi:hypothetical protein
MMRVGLEGEVESGESSSEQASSEPAQPELEVQRFENYEVVKREDGTPVELGRGAMGITYKRSTLICTARDIEGHQRALSR